MIKVLDEFVRTVTVDGATLIEERIKLVLQDKPRWLPQRLWRAILKRVIAIETQP